MMTRWQEDALIARIRETKARIAAEAAPVAHNGGTVQPWAIAAGWSPERDYFDPFLGRFTAAYPVQHGVK
jgi:hypothetical protein